MSVAESVRAQLPEGVPASPFYKEEHQVFRHTVRRFVEREIMPHVDQWDEAEEFPRELYGKASAAGLLQLGFPEVIGQENKGFIGVMLNFNQERLGMSAGACGYAKVCLDEAIAYARERHTFGRPLISNQVVRHRLVDMAMRINAVKSTLELLAWRVGQGEKPVAEICMLKNLATSTMEFCANEAMQVFGGAGYCAAPRSSASIARPR